MVAAALNLPRASIGVALAASLAVHAGVLALVAARVWTSPPSLDVMPASLPELVVTLRGETQDTPRGDRAETLPVAPAAASAAPSARPAREVIVHIAVPQKGRPPATPAHAARVEPAPATPDVDASEPAGTATPSPAGSEPVSSELATAKPSPPLPTPTPVGYRHQPAPVYPESARRDGQQGLAVVEVLVTRDGVATNASVAQSSGHAALDAAALDAVRQWRFVPATRDGEAIDARIRVPIRFRLSDEGR